MKFLLTSAGLTNKSIAKTLLNLAYKPFNKLSLAFIPTAATIEEGGKEWMIEDLVNCQKLGFAQIDIVDIAALPKSIALGRLKSAEVLFFEGGNTYFLMHWLKKSGLNKLLPRLLKTRVYVGLSAGSRVVTKNFSLGNRDIPYPTKNDKGLGYFDFHFIPHLNSPYFPERKMDYMEKLSVGVKEPVYAMDDNSALKIIDNKIEVVSEGKWKKFN